MGSTSRPYIGGQAVLEGVMMRAPRSFAVVVRRRDGTLTVRERGVLDAKRPWTRWPFVRGLTSLVESLTLGGEALRFSADLLERDLSNPAVKPGIVSMLGASLLALVTSDAGDDAAHATPAREKSGSQALMIALMVLVLIALPQAFAAGYNRLFHLNLNVQSPGFQVVTGIFKLVVIVGYMLALRRIPEIRRVFQYHGAEHKAISTYEAGEALTVPNARTKTTLHPRCGTTFLVMVAIVSICVFTLIGSFLPPIHTGHLVLDHVIFFLEKLPFLPVIASVTFELQRVLARYCTKGPLRMLLWPGFLVQKVTTIEPDDTQLEVALASLRATLFRQTDGADSAGANDDVTFSSYEALLGADRLRPAA